MGDRSKSRGRPCHSVLGSDPAFRSMPYAPIIWAIPGGHRCSSRVNGRPKPPRGRAGGGRCQGGVHHARQLTGRSLLRLPQRRAQARAGQLQGRQDGDGDGQGLRAHGSVGLAEGHRHHVQLGLRGHPPCFPQRSMPYAVHRPGQSRAAIGAPAA